MAAASSEVDLDQAISALAAIWFDPHRSWSQAAQDAASFLPTMHPQRDAPRAALLSQALGAMRLGLVLRPRESGPMEPFQQMLDTVRAAGWPRATGLAEAVWAFAQLYSGSQLRQRGLKLLQAQEVDAQASPVERLCRQVALGTLHAMSGNFEAALTHGLQAQALASRRDFDILSAQAVQGLIYVFLSVGDLEGADNALRPYKEWERIGFAPAANYYNQLLCDIVAGRDDAAARLFEENAWLCDDESLAKSGLSDMLALVRARRGEVAEAERLLARALPEWALKHYPLLANSAWIRAATYLALNHPQAARDEVEQFLAGRAANAIDHHLSPMNATQIHRLRSEACEALGDLKAALAALKDSRASCFAWVGDSVQARLSALHAAAQEPARSPQQAARQSDRVAAVAAAVEQARAAAAEPPPPAAAAEPADSAEDRLQRQQRFFSHVTHEMRNPLNGVLGMTSLLMMSDLDERQRKHLNLARSSAQMLLGLCNDVLDLAKLDAGHFELRPQDADVAVLIAETAEMLRAQVQLRGVVLGERIDPALPRKLWCDPLRVQQVLMNLLSNATKFTRAGRIDIVAQWTPPRAADEPGELRIEVQDTGLGIAPEGLARLFQEFSQLHAGQVAGGTGLGLALCRSLVERMSGRIGVHSVQAQGSTFWFTLPLRPSAVAGAPRDVALAA